MEPAEILLPEHRRFCVACGGAVGRGRDGRPGRLRGTCRWCRETFDLTPHLLTGEVLAGRRGGAWRVTGPRVRGGHSWLHDAMDDATGRSGVLSRVRGPRGAEAGHLASEEPEVLLALSHPGMVRVLDVVDDPPPAPQPTTRAVAPRSRHLVLAPVPGEAAGDTGPMPGAEAARVVLDALPALAHLHDRGLLHADLTPDHVVTGGPAGTVLIDLGSLRRVEDRTSPVWTTEGYVAPEIAPGGAGPSPASDVFALGRVLAALVTAPREHVLAEIVRAATAEDPGRRPDLCALATALRAVVAPPGDSGPGRRDD